MTSLVVIILVAVIVVLVGALAYASFMMSGHTPASSVKANGSAASITQSNAPSANLSVQNESATKTPNSSAAESGPANAAPGMPTNSTMSANGRGANETNATINPYLSPNPVTADWHGNVTIYVEGNYLVVKSTDEPTEHGSFPNKNNPNAIEKQNFTFLIPLHPEVGPHTVPIPIGGAIGVALNGVPFFGPYTATGQLAPVVEVFDQCNGHPDMDGVYHYHEFSPCIANSTQGEHSPLIGFAFDGFPIYGPYGDNGTLISNTMLDSCNGYYDPEVGSYVYVATNGFPYLLGCYEGTPVMSDVGAN